MFKRGDKVRWAGQPCTVIREGRDYMGPFVELEVPGREPVKVSAAGVTAAPTDEPQRAVCCQCGREAPVCCDAGNDGRGNHYDPVCARCCGPHPRGRRGSFERMDCDV